MKKLKLNLETIQVESFSAETLKGSRGTIAGHLPTFDLLCDADSALSYHVPCGESIMGSCESCGRNTCPEMAEPASRNGDC